MNICKSSQQSPVSKGLNIFDHLILTERGRTIHRQQFTMNDYEQQASC